MAVSFDTAFGKEVGIYKHVKNMCKVNSVYTRLYTQEIYTI